METGSPPSDDQYLPVKSSEDSSKKPLDNTRGTVAAGVMLSAPGAMIAVNLFHASEWTVVYVLSVIILAIGVVEPVIGFYDWLKKGLAELFKDVRSRLRFR
jgi:hypothetical protein